MALRGNRRVAGFTLLEVVAALTLLGIGLSLLYAGYLQASHLEARAAESGTALTLAKSILAQAEAGQETAAEGSFEGAPGYHWALARESLGDLGLVRLTATVTWGQEYKRSTKAWTLTGDAL